MREFNYTTKNGLHTMLHIGSGAETPEGITCLLKFDTHTDGGSYSLDRDAVREDGTERFAVAMIVAELVAIIESDRKRTEKLIRQVRYNRRFAEQALDGLENELARFEAGA